MEKIIAIGVIGMFLLTSITSAASLLQNKSINVTNNEEIQNYEKNDITSFDTNNHVSQRVTVISDGITIVESDKEGIIFLDDNDNEQEGETKGLVNNGLPDYEVSEFACWCTVDTEGTQLQLVFGMEHISTNIGDNYDDENGFWVHTYIYAIYPDYNQCISGQGTLFTKWDSGASIKVYEMDMRTTEDPTPDLKPESIKIEISTAVPESNKDNNVRIIPCEWGVFVSGRVYKKEILRPKEPVYAFIFFEADDPQYFDNFYMLADNSLSFSPIPGVEDGTYWISAPATQSEYTLRAVQPSIGLLIALLHVDYGEIPLLELLFRLLSKAVTIGPVEPNDHINLDFVFGLFGGITSSQNSQQSTTTTTTTTTATSQTATSTTTGQSSK